MPDTVEFIDTGNYAILNGMDTHNENMYMLLFMLSVLRERQSAWELTTFEREQSKKGIKALQAAVDALSVQIYA
jgi:hypothetical protein